MAILLKTEMDAHKCAENKYLQCIYSRGTLPYIMSRLVTFRSTDADDKIFDDLQKATGLTVAAIIRQAIRLMHKKEVKK